jgi:DNA modification methylase
VTPYYQDDAVTLYHGDCREILPTLPKHDLLLTDPPYGIGYGGKKNSVGGSDGRRMSRWKTWKTDWDEVPACQELIDEVIGICSESIIWGGNYFTLPPSMGWLVWDKGQRNFTLADAELAWTSRNKAIRVFTYTRPEALVECGRVHPTQKPIALMRWCLSFAPDAQIILDPFAGSGTTGVAAKLEGRKATLIEMEERYCEIAANRLSQGVLF